MKQAIDDVTVFHEMCAVPVISIPKIPTLDRQLLRWRLIDEEVNKELHVAMDNGNLADIADGIADAIYVLIGTALEYGIPLESVWNAVQEANMNKKDPVTGLVIHNEYGKVIKPPGWKKPDIRAIINAHTPK